jgi:hypothetical protein
MVTSRMPTFAHSHAAREQNHKCADCLRLEAIVADIAAFAETLRKSRDCWRDLAIEGAGREAVADLMLTDPLHRCSHRPRQPAGVSIGTQLPEN